MINLTKEEAELVKRVRELEEYQKIEIRIDKEGAKIFTITTTERGTL